MAKVDSTLRLLDTFEMKTDDPESSLERRLADELLRVERRAQEQVAWVLAFTVFVLVLIAEHVLPRVDKAHSHVIRSISAGLLIWFTLIAVLIRRSVYAPWFKYANAVIQVTMVTAVIVIDADMRGPLYALSSMPPLFCGLVIGVSSLAFSPTLALSVGLLASAEFLGLYAVHLRPMIRAAGLDGETAIGWEVTAMKAVIFIAIGVTGALMAKKARTLLTRAVRDAHAEERLRAVESEMALAREIQQRLIPSGEHAADELETASVYRPAKNVGGDYFDVIECGDARRLLVVADVSGKGYPAALTMSNVQAMVRVLARREPALASLADEINTSLCRNSVRGRFVTMAIVLVDARRGVVEYVNAGHNAPIVAYADGSTRMLDEGGPVFGALEGVEYSVGCVPFPAGSALCAFTDGLSELRDENRRDLGIERIARAVHAARADGAERIRAALLASADAHSGGAAPHDDLTFVVMTRPAGADDRS